MPNPSQTAPSRSRRTSGAADGSSSARRQELLTVAAEVFARRGFQTATVRDIGDAAGILSGSLYHHFRSKEQILEELLIEYLERLSEEYRVAAETVLPPSDVLRGMVTVGLGTVAKDRHLAVIVHNDYEYLVNVDQFQFVRRHYRYIQDRWLDVIRRGQAEGDFRTDLKPESVYRVVMGALLASIRWHPAVETRNVESLADEVTAVFLDGVRVRK